MGSSLLAGRSDTSNNPLGHLIDLPQVAAGSAAQYIQVETGLQAQE